MTVMSEGLCYADLSSLSVTEINRFKSELASDGHLTGLTDSQWRKLQAYLVKTEAGEVVAMLAVVRMGNTKWVEIGPAYVLPSYRNQGITSQLFQRAEADLLQRGCSVFACSHNAFFIQLMKRQKDYQTICQPDFLAYLSLARRLPGLALVYLLTSRLRLSLIREWYRKRKKGILIQSATFYWLRFN